MVEESYILSQFSHVVDTLLSLLKLVCSVLVTFLHCDCGHLILVLKLDMVLLVCLDMLVSTLEMFI